MIRESTRCSKSIKILQAVALLIAVLACVACGGGGGNSGGGNSSGSSGSSSGGNSSGGSSSSSSGGSSFGGSFTAAEVEAGDNPKQLAFSWDFDGTAAGFRLESNPDGASGFAPVDINGDGAADTGDQLGADAAGLDLQIALHRTDFAQARYQIVALDDDGAVLDSSDELSIMQLTVNALIGYFKASYTGGINGIDDFGDRFGYSVALSGDGATLAVGAYGEDSKATGIDDGEQTDNSESNSGAVYVFTRDGAGIWSQQAYIKASNTGEDDRFGYSVALSGDGATLAVGAYGEDSKATGIGGEQTDNTIPDSGAVYVFTREGSDVWSQQAYIKASNRGSGDAFGVSVALSVDGATLAVGAMYEGGSTGAAYVFTRDEGTWSQQAYIKASNLGPSDFFGVSVALSGDGATLAVGARGEDSNATGIDGDHTDNSADSSGAVYVFTRNRFGNWFQQAYIKASNTGSRDAFGVSVALSVDGATLAVGALAEDSAATGINGEQFDIDDAADSGAVYVFTRDGAGTWSQQAYIKASNTDTGDRFGESVALSGDDATLAVGAWGEDSAAKGINGEQFDIDDAAGSGAAYVFIRDEGVWSQQAYIKASNTDAGDRFGLGVALSGDGATLAVGAYYEDSDATGIDGEQTDNSAENSGAVYIY